MQHGFKRSPAPNESAFPALGSAASLAACGGHVAYIHDTETEFSVVLPRADIASAQQVKMGLMKRAEITMKDGGVFTFDYGMLSPKKLVAAVNAYQHAGGSGLGAS